MTSVLVRLSNYPRKEQMDADGLAEPQFGEQQTGSVDHGGAGFLRIRVWPFVLVFVHAMTLDTWVFHHSCSTPKAGHDELPDVRQTPSLPVCGQSLAIWGASVTYARLQPLLHGSCSVIS